MSFSLKILRTIALLTLVAQFSTHLAKGAEQTLTLYSGWNLVSFWIEPNNNGVHQVFEGLPAGRFQRAFGFDGNAGSAGEWENYISGISPDKSWLNTLAEIKAGLGYWVLLSDGPPVDMTVIGKIAMQDSKVLRTGWHLIGLNNKDSRPWHDLFGPAASSIGSLFSYDSPMEEFFGFESPEFGNIDVNGDGKTDFEEYGWQYGTEYGVLRNIEPGKAYWVHFGQNTTIGPVMEVCMESDVDAWPAPDATTNSWNPLVEDTDMNSNGVLDYGCTVAGAYDDYGNPVINTQNTVWFRIPKKAEYPLIITQQHLKIMNRGSGVLLFEIISSIDGLTIAPTTGQVLPGEAGVSILLTVDLTKLSLGETNDNLTVNSNGGVKLIRVRITKPLIQGQYKGSIMVKKVSGNWSPLGRWPFKITLDSSGNGIIHGSKSFHFPDNVALSGTSTGAAFSSTGAIDLTAGHPLNPFGRDISRSITLSGALTADESAAGANLGLIGNYMETITGLANGPIEIRGTFDVVPTTN
jgi:hypothetical protein